VDDPHCVWGFFSSFCCGEIFSQGHTKKGLWAMICTKGFFLRKKGPKIVVFLVGCHTSDGLSGEPADLLMLVP